MPREATQCDLKATPKRVDRQRIATPKPPQCDLNATSMRPQSYLKAWRKHLCSSVSICGSLPPGCGSGFSGLFGKGVDHLDLRLPGHVHHLDDYAERGRRVGANG